MTSILKSYTRVLISKTYTERERGVGEGTQTNQISLQSCQSYFLDVLPRHRNIMTDKGLTEVVAVLLYSQQKDRPLPVFLL